MHVWCLIHDDNCQAAALPIAMHVWCLIHDGNCQAAALPIAMHVWRSEQVQKEGNGGMTSPLFLSCLQTELQVCHAYIPAMPSYHAGKQY
eukprot:1136461-Pelagomonas_calceolata.AAC.1